MHTHAHRDVGGAADHAAVTARHTRGRRDAQQHNATIDTAPIISTCANARAAQFRRQRIGHDSFHRQADDADEDDVTITSMPWRKNCHMTSRARRCGAPGTLPPTATAAGSRWSRSPSLRLSAPPTRDHHEHAEQHRGNTNTAPSTDCCRRGVGRRRHAAVPQAAIALTGPWRHLRTAADHAAPQEPTPSTTWPVPQLQRFSHSVGDQGRQRVRATAEPLWVAASATLKPTAPERQQPSAIHHAGRVGEHRHRQRRHRQRDQDHRPPRPVSRA